MKKVSISASVASRIVGGKSSKAAIAAKPKKDELASDARVLLDDAMDKLAMQQESLAKTATLMEQHTPNGELTGKLKDFVGRFNNLVADGKKLSAELFKSLGGATAGLYASVDAEALATIILAGGKKGGGIAKGAGNSVESALAKILVAEWNEEFGDAQEKNGLLTWRTKTKRGNYMWSVKLGRLPELIANAKIVAFLEKTYPDLRSVFSISTSESGEEGSFEFNPIADKAITDWNTTYGTIPMSKGKLDWSAKDRKHKGRIFEWTVDTKNPKAGSKGQTVPKLFASEETITFLKAQIPGLLKGFEHVKVENTEHSGFPKKGVKTKASAVLTASTIDRIIHS